MAASVLDADTIRRSEDALVDGLVLGAVEHGAVVIAAAYARAYIDVNREPYDLDPSMFEDELPDFARGRSARVAAGLGSIARIVAEGQEIYGRKLTFAEATQRIEAVHAPYHAALVDLIGAAKAQFRAAVLIDWHSMPSAAARTLGQSGDFGGAGVCDLVLGDRFGSACAPQITAQRPLCWRLHHRILRPPARWGARPADRDQPRPLYGRGQPATARGFRAAANRP